jgi:ATP-dependent RNA helicase RhlE
MAAERPAVTASADRPAKKPFKKAWNKDAPNKGGPRGEARHGETRSSETRGQDSRSQARPGGHKPGGKPGFKGNRSGGDRAHYSEAPRPKSEGAQFKRRSRS